VQLQAGAVRVEPALSLAEGTESSPLLAQGNHRREIPGKTVPMNGRSANGSASVVGGWLGTYNYGGLQAVLRPVRFEATLRSALPGAAQFYGEIVDDGSTGTASVDGSQESDIIRFDKTYSVSSKIGRVRSYEYCGVISEDGKAMRGTWRVSVRIAGLKLPQVRGTWHARRMWMEDDESIERSEEESLIQAVSNPEFLTAVTR
jgi:hypothetical protein